MENKLQTLTIDEICWQSINSGSEDYAILEPERTVTFAELGQRADDVCRLLRQYDVRTGDAVGLYMPLGVDLAAAILGVLRAGGVYVPLDPAFPRRRLALMQKMSNCRVILSSDQKNIINVRNQSVHRQGEHGFGNRTPVSRSAGDFLSQLYSPAYVMFTSGSTGTPKGVLGTHQSVVNRVRWMLQHFSIQEDDVFVWKSSPGVVDSVWDLFQAIISHRPLFIPPPECTSNQVLLLEQIRDWRSTRLSTSPSQLAAWLEYFEDKLRDYLTNLRLLDVTGEPFPMTLARRSLSVLTNVRMLNRYGTTEVPSCLCYEVTKFSESTGEFVSLGRPISHTRAYVFNEIGQEAERGEEGELCIAGAQVAAGYICFNSNRGLPETRPRFVEVDVGKGRDLIYRTGDLVREENDGSFTYLGRRDNTINVRGYRVNLEELDAVFARSTHILQCAAVAHKRGSSMRVSLFYVPRVSTCDQKLLREFGRAELPEFMIPDRFVPISELPTLPNGKVDRVALTNWQDVPVCSTLTSDLPKAVAVLLQEILDETPSHPDDVLLDFGLTSLRAMGLAALAQERFGEHVSVTTILNCRTVQDLINILRPKAPVEVASNTPVFFIHRTDDQSGGPLASGQALLWRLDQTLGQHQALYNDVWTIELLGDVSEEGLKYAFWRLADQHPIWRTRYVLEDQGVRQEVLPEALIEWQSWDWREELAGGEQCIDAAIRDAATHERCTCFDLQAGPMMRVRFIRVGRDAYRLLVATHHITEDAWSGRIINVGLNGFYQEWLTGEPACVVKPSVSMVDLGRWQQDCIEKERYTTQEAYWLQEIKDLWKLNLFGKPKQPLGFPGSETVKILDESVKQHVDMVCACRGTTHVVVVLAALGEALCTLFEVKEVLVGCPVAYRHYPGVSDTIGFLTNLLPIRLTKQPTFAGTVDAVRTTLLNGFAHQDVPLCRVADRLECPWGPWHPVCDISFAQFGVMERVGAGLKLRGVRSQLLDDVAPDPFSKFPLSVNFKLLNSGIQLACRYNTNLVKAEKVSQVIEMIAATLARCCI